MTPVHRQIYESPGHSELTHKSIAHTFCIHFKSFPLKYAIFVSIVIFMHFHPVIQLTWHCRNNIQWNLKQNTNILLKKINLKMSFGRRWLFCPLHFPDSKVHGATMGPVGSRLLPTCSPLGSGAFASTCESDTIRAENTVAPLPSSSSIMCSTKASSVKGLSPRPFPEMDN